MEYFHSKKKYNEFFLDKLKIWSSYIDGDKGLEFFMKKNKKKTMYLDKYINNFIDENLN